MEGKFKMSSAKATARTTSKELHGYTHTLEQMQPCAAYACDKYKNRRGIGVNKADLQQCHNLFMY